jgi:hypothetical protein
MKTRSKNLALKITRARAQNKISSLLQRVAPQGELQVKVKHLKAVKHPQKKLESKSINVLPTAL